MARMAARVLVWGVLAVGSLWAVLALWFDASRHRWLAGLLSLLLVAIAAGLFVGVRPIRRAMAAVAGLIVLVAIWWSLIPPRNDRDWMPDVARLPRATIAGNRLVVENVRNFDYRTEKEFTPRWETRTYDLGQLKGVDLFLSYWGPTLIAHTIASWEFAGRPPLAISIETRKEKGESYSALRGFFRQYELYYVAADERDVIGLRTNFRGERVYLYRTRTNPDAARAILLDYMREINQLNRQPSWYNALTQNCTTSIRHHVLHVGAGNPLDWRILANGHIDELGYERGTINTSLPFPELKARSDITARARAADSQPDFSRRIRANLPARPAPRRQGR